MITFDKKLKILKCLDVLKPVNVHEVFKNSKIKDYKEFEIELDELGVKGYISGNSKTLDVKLKNICSKKLYIKDRHAKNIAIVIALVSLAIATLSILLQLFTIFPS